jgi:hypothetical protein
LGIEGKNRLQKESFHNFKEFVLQQQEEVEKAIIGGGKYSIDTPYKEYEKIDSSWFRQTSEAQRNSHLKKFNNLAVNGTNI